MLGFVNGMRFARILPASALQAHLEIAADDFVWNPPVCFEAKDSLVLEPAEVLTKETAAWVNVSLFEWANHQYRPSFLHSTHRQGRKLSRGGCSISRRECTTFSLMREVPS